MLESAGRPASRRLFYGWVLVGVAFLFAFVESAVFNPVLSVFIRPLQAEFGWSRTEIALATTVGALAGVVVSPIAGRLIDRFGPRPFLMAGGVLIGSGLIALAFVTELWQFYLAFGIGRMTAMSITNLSNSVVIANWFIRRRGLAMGVGLLGERVGQAFVPLLATAIIFAGVTTASGLAGQWRLAWLVLGIGGLALTVLPALLLVRTRPEDEGALPDGDTIETRASAPAAAPEPQFSVSQAVRIPAFWLITAALTAAFFVAAGLNLHLIAYWQDAGLSPDESVSILTIYSLVGAAGSLAWGAINDRVGVRAAYAACLALAAIAVPLLVAPVGYGTALAFGVVYGFAIGGSFTLAGIVYPTYFGRASQASIRGAAVPAIYIGNAIGPVVAGIAYDRTGSYLVIFSVFGLLLALGAGCLALARPPLVRLA